LGCLLGNWLISEMRLFRAAVYSNFFVAYVLATLALSSYFIVPDLSDFHWYVPASIFIGSFALYCFHRLYKIDFIPENQLGERHIWMIKHANQIKIIMSVAVFIGMLILPFFKADDVVWLIPAVVVSIGYTVPFIPTEEKWWRLRDVPLVKPMIIAFCVTYLTLAFPIFEQTAMAEVFEPFNQQLFLERFAFLLAVTIPFEMRDQETDAKAGMNTLATKFGFLVSKRVAISATITWFVLIVLRLFILEQMVAILPFLLVFILLLLAIKKLNPTRGEFYYVLCFEGMILIYSSSIILAQTLA
jgi:4-hydroxybenzoate polyprenyltransferase